MNNSSPQPTAPTHSLLTVAELAAWLKVTPRQVFELTRSRSLKRSNNPLPVLKIHKKLLRFKRSEVIAWLSRVETARPN
jgi:hypothetical protein